MATKARTTDGRFYEGNRQYAGNGVVKSCSFCMRHRPVSGFKKTARGWKCAECQGRPRD